MTIVLVWNEPYRKSRYIDSLRQLLEGATSLDLAISYVKLGGWHLVAHELKKRKLGLSKVRLVVTDQFAITQPDAVRAIAHAGATIRNYVGGRVYHPKVMIAYADSGRPVGAIVGSANLSESALTLGVEAGIYTSDSAVLASLKEWFNSLIGDDHATIAFTTKSLAALDKLWKKAAAARVRQGLKKPNFQEPTAPISAEVESLEDLFVTVLLPIGTVNMDHAGNNIRNLDHLREVLESVPNLSGKQRSELHLLGILAPDNSLTRLGERLLKCRSRRSLALAWCRWVARQTEDELEAVNPRIAAFRRAASRFWRLRQDVRDFFFNRMNDPTARLELQTIELLCSGSEVVCELGIEEFRELAPVLNDPAQLPPSLRRAVESYVHNKGARSWGGDDRRIMLEAWRVVSRVS